MSDWNTQVIEEFRSNEGKVPSHFGGDVILLLHAFGRTTGLERVNPLMYLPDDGGWVVFATKGGHPSHPDWFLNLEAHPDVTIEIGTGTVPVRATPIREGPERDELFARQVALFPQFGEYEVKAAGHRTIPVAVLQRR